MGSTKVIGIGNGGQNILEGIRKSFPPDIATELLCVDRGNVINYQSVFIGSFTRLVLISCLGGHSSTIVPKVIKLAKEKNIECLCVCIMPFSTEGEDTCHFAKKTMEQIQADADILIVLKNDWILERYGDLFVNQAFRKMDELVYKLISNYITND